MSVHVAILAGGRGERFWPLSRAARPKQVLSLVGDRSLLAETVERARAGASPDQVWIVSSAEQRPALESLALPIPSDRFLWEPVARNTAPAIAAAAALVRAHGEALGAARGAAPGAPGSAHEDDTLLLVLPADHWIPEVGAFWKSVERGAELALSRDAIVTFGIRVTRPETGYGYIERGQPLGERVFSVDRFHEKPTAEVAREYQAAGRFYWNAGIFLARPQVLLDEVAQHIPEMASLLEALQSMLRNERALSGERALQSERVVPKPHGYSDGWKRYFEECPSIAIDYGVLERSSRVAVVEAEFAWSDLGGWESWAELREADSDGNRVSGELIAQDAHDNIVLADPSHLVALLGVSDLIVIQTEDALLICPRDRAQEVRDLVKRGRTDERWKDHF